MYEPLLDYERLSRLYCYQGSNIGYIALAPMQPLFIDTSKNPDYDLMSQNPVRAVRQSSEAVIKGKVRRV